MSKLSNPTGTTLVELIFAIGVIGMVCCMAASAFTCSVKIDNSTQNTTVAYHAAQSATEALHDLSVQQIIDNEYVGQVKYFDVQGIPGVSPVRLGKILVSNVSLPADQAACSAGVHLRVEVTVEVKGAVLARIVSHKYDGGGFIPPME